MENTVLNERITELSNALSNNIDVSCPSGMSMTMISIYVLIYVRNNVAWMSIRSENSFIYNKEFN